MADDVDIPLNISVPNIDKLLEINQVLLSVIQHINTAASSSDKWVTAKSFLQLEKQVTALNTVAQKYSVTGEMIAKREEGARTVRAADEMAIQRLLENASKLAGALRSTNIEEKVIPAMRAMERQSAQLRLELDKLERVQGQGDAAQQRKVDADIKRGEERLKTLEERIAFAQSRVNAAKNEETIDRAVAGRQRAPEIARRFDQTPEGQAVIASAAAREVEKENVAYNKMREDASRRNIVYDQNAAKAAEAASIKRAEFIEKAERADLDRDNKIVRASIARQRKEEAAQDATYQDAENQNILFDRRTKAKARREEAAIIRREDATREAAEREDITRGPQYRASQRNSRYRSAIDVNNLDNEDSVQLAATALRSQRERQQRIRATAAAPEGTSSDEALARQVQAAAAKALGSTEKSLLDNLGMRASILAQYTALGAAFNALGNTFESVLHLEAGLKTLGAVSGSTGAELAKLREVIIDTSQKTPFASKELTELAKELVQAGVSSHEVTASLSSMAVLASATGGTLKQVGEIFTSVFEVFKIRGAESAKVADQLAITLTKSRLGTAEFGATLQTVSTTAVENGLSFNQLQAALAALSNQGLRSGTLLATGFRQIIVDLADPPKKLADRFKELGLTISDVDLKAVGYSGVLANLTKAGFTTADAFATLPARTAQAFAAFLKSGNDFKHAEEMLNSAGGAADQNAKRMESLENQLKRLGNTIIAVTQTGAGPLIGVMKVAASGLTSLVGGLENAGTAVSVVATVMTGAGVTALTRYVGGMVAARLATAQATVAAAQAATAIQGVAAAQTAASVAGTGLNLPFVLATAAISAVIYGLGMLGNASSTASEKEEELKTKVNAAKFAVEEKQKALEGLNQFLEQTAAKERLLTRDQDQLNATVSEARDRFGGLSDAVYGNITSFSQLISKLQEVRTQLRSGLLTDIANARVQLGAALNQAREEAGKATGQGVLEGVARRAGIGPGIMYSEPGMIDPYAERMNTTAGIMSMMPKELQRVPELAQAVEIISGRGEKNTETIAQVLNSLSRLPEEYRKTLTPFIEKLNDIQAPLRRQRELQNDQRTNERAGAVVTMMGYNQGYKQLEDGVQPIQSVSDSLKNLRDIGDVQKRSEEGGERIAVLNAYVKRVEEFRKTLDEEQRRAFDETDVAKSTNTFRSMISEQRKQLDKALEDSTIKHADVTIKRTTRELTDLTRDLASTKNADERQGIISAAKEKVEERARAERTKVDTQATEERDKSGADITSINLNRRENLASVEAQYRSSIRQIDEADKGFKVGELNKMFEEIGERLKTLGTRTKGGGRLGSRDERDELRDKQRGIIRQILGLEGVTDQTTIDREINRRVDQRGIRAEVERGATGANPRRAFRDVTVTDRRSAQDDLDKINKDADAAIKEARIPQEEISAFLDAARKNENFPRAVIREKQRELNRRRIEAEESEITIQEAKTRQLNELLANVKADIEKNNAFVVELTSRFGIKSTAEGNVTGNFSDMEQRSEIIAKLDEYKKNINQLGGRDGTGGMVGKLEADIKASNAAQRRASVERDARLQAPEEGIAGIKTGLGNGFEDWKQRKGLNDPSSKVTADLLSKSLDSVSDRFGSFVSNWVTGAGKVKFSFKEMASSVIADAAKMASQQATNQLIKMAFSGILSLAGLGAGGASGGDSTSPFGGAGTEITTAYEGGVIRGFIDGGIVPGTHLGRDTVYAKLAPGESILNRRATSLVGEENINKMNSSAIESQAPIQPPAPREPDNVSVYVVDKNTNPVLGPKDILATVHKDMLEGGTTKKLVKNIQLGTL